MEKAQQSINKEVALLTALEEAGYEAYIVGGYVRDELLNKIPNDVDIATNATPNEIETVFEGQTIDFVGKQFGVMMVNGVEIATFRSETYQTPSKPDVVMVTSFKEDASRRDFTINAMGKKLNGEIVDYYGGREDLASKLVRAVENPKERFTEDPSRILRAIYLASSLNFTIEEQTKVVIMEKRHLLTSVPKELVGKIIQKAIAHGSLAKFLVLTKELELLDYVFPYLSHTVGMEQNPMYHDADVFTHIVRVIASAESRYPGNVVLALSALLHDVAKGLPEIRGVNDKGMPNDLNHEEAGVPIAKKALNDLQIDKHTKQRVLFVVEHHGLRLPGKPKKRSVMKALRKMAPSWKNKTELHQALEDLIRFMYVDADGFEPAFGSDMKKLTKTVKPFFFEQLDEMVLFREDLPVNGGLLAKRGLVGKEIGNTLDEMIRLNICELNQAEKFLEKKIGIEGKYLEL